MSIPVMALVWTSTMTDPTEVAILSCLASHANDDGESCFAGVPRIAKLVRRSERTVIRTLDSLEKAGWLEIERGNGRGSLTHYRLNVEQLKGCQDVTLSKTSKRVTLAQKRVTPATRKGDIDDNPPHPLFGRNVFETKANETPPNPLVTEGGSATSAAIDRALAQLANGLAITDKRVKRKLREAIALEADKGESPPTVALAMMAAWREQGKHSDLLKVNYGPVKFFCLGIWKNQNQWHWDESALRLAREARMGGMR